MKQIKNLFLAISSKFYSQNQKFLTHFDVFDYLVIKNVNLTQIIYQPPVSWEKNGVFNNKL